MIDEREKVRRVELVPPNPSWPGLFSAAKEQIKNILKENCLDIHHIGSTAIPGIYAKPIIDMLPVVKDLSLVDSLNSKFEALGYVCMGEYGISGRRFYWKSKAERTHNIHLFEQGSPEINRHVAFRDFMREHVTSAKAYSVIKGCLADVFPYDIENYVNGKASFVQMIDYQTGQARAKQLNAKDSIVIEPYNPAWPKLADAEIKAIKTLTNLPYISIDHVGSTAVPELSSEPIIDIFIVIPSIDQVKEWIVSLQSLGYDFWSENPDQEHLRFFKGRAPFGERRTHHIHLVQAQNNESRLRDLFLFRDILRNDEKIRRNYEALKFRLAREYPDDREIYTEQKTGFIEQTFRESALKNCQ